MRPLEVTTQNITVCLILVTALTAVAFVPAFMTAELNGSCPATAEENSTVALGGRWAGRFLQAAMAQALMAAGLTGYLLFRGVFGRPSASRIIAAGGAANWLFVGYLGYLLLGLMGSAIMGLFYWYIEVEMGLAYGGWTNLLAWGHLILLNVGVVGATWLMMHAGYRGGAAALPPQLGGQGVGNAQLHAMLKGYPPYIAAFIVLGLLGVLLGTIGYGLTLAHIPGMSCP